MVDPNTTPPVVDPVQQRSGTNLAEHYLVFELDGERYAVDQAHVLEVQPWTEPYPVWKAPEFILGALIDGKTVVPVVDLHRVFKLPSLEPSPTTRIIVLKTRFKNRSAFFGFQVDRVISSIRTEPDSIQQVTGLEQDARRKFITGIAYSGNDKIMLINVGDLLAKDAVH